MAFKKIPKSFLKSLEPLHHGDYTVAHFPYIIPWTSLNKAARLLF